MTDFVIEERLVKPVHILEQDTLGFGTKLKAGEYGVTDTTTGKLIKGDATANARNGGIVIGSDNPAGATYVRKGILFLGHIFDSLAFDDPVYLSDTPGQLSDIPGTVSFEVGRIVPATGQMPYGKLLRLDL